MEGVFTMFQSFSEISLTTWAILAGLIIGGIVLFIIARNKRKWTTRMMANASLCIALAFLLSYVKLYEMPQGGSVTLASMLPIFMFSYAYGVAPGLMIGFAYGLLQFVQGGWFVHPIQFLLDYPLAFAALGLSGFFHDKKNGLITGYLAGTFGRFLFHEISGFIFYTTYVDTFKGNLAALWASTAYNLSYILPEIIITLVLLAIPAVRNALAKVKILATE